MRGKCEMCGKATSLFTEKFHPFLGLVCPECYDEPDASVFHDRCSYCGQAKPITENCVCGGERFQTVGDSASIEGLTDECPRCSITKPVGEKCPLCFRCYPQAPIRTFDTGATRDSLEGKLAVHRFMSPLVVKRYCEYLQEHRVQSDGQIREPDNWKKGIPQDAYVESLFRHVMIDAWTQFETTGKIEQDTLCAVLFNAMGYLFEDLK